MSRPLRIEAANHYYYVRNFARKGAAVFMQQDDLELFLSTLIETCMRYKVCCYSYTLLPDQFHLLLHTQQANLASFMRQLSGVYTQAYNKKYQLNGALFKGRYQSSLLEPNNYPKQLSIYIHQLFLLNINTSQTLSLSSWHDYLAQNSADKSKKTIFTSLLKTEFKTFYGRQNTQTLINHKLPSDISSPLSKKHLPAIIGSYLFQEKYQALLANCSAECSAIPRMQAALQSQQRQQHSLDIVSCTANAFRVANSGVLQAQYGIKKSSDARNMAMYLCQQHTNMTLKEIAKTFGVSHYASVSNRISYFKKRLKTHISLQQSIQQINQQLRDKKLNDESLNEH